MPIAYQRGVFHRDIFAHWLRYQHIITLVKRKEDKILDLGCGEGNLAMSLYANMMGPKSYYGIDIRKTLIEKNKQNFKPNFEVIFECADLTKSFSKKIYDYKPDVITALEFVEHIPPKTVGPILKEIDKLNPRLFILSTPCFNGLTKSKNHIKEFTFEEMFSLLHLSFKRYEIKPFGTFISKNDFMKVADKQDIETYNKLAAYYNCNVMSVLMAPLYSAASRNCIWILSRK